MQLLNIRLMKEFLREALPHYKKVSVAQLERADKLAFARVAELTEGGLSRDVTGRYPMADALLAVIEVQVHAYAAAGRFQLHSN